MRISDWSSDVCSSDLHMSSLRETIPFELAWPRLFYLFGPGQSPNSLYSQLQAAIARGDESFDMPGGEPVRDYLPLPDAAPLLVDVAIAARSVKRRVGKECVGTFGCRWSVVHDKKTT